LKQNYKPTQNTQTNSKTTRTAARSLEQQRHQNHNTRKTRKKNTAAAEDINRPMTANPEPKSHLN
jgi:hypothetical protein